MSGTSERRTLRILMLTEDFYPKTSGGAFIDWNVAKYLVRDGDSVTVVTPYDDVTTSSFETVEGVEIRRPFRSHNPSVHPNSKRGIARRILFVALVIPYLIKLCWRNDFNLVYSTNHLLHLPAAIVSTVFGLSHISFVGYSPSIREDVLVGNPLVLLERLNFRFFMGDRVLCQTPSVRDLLFETYDRDVIQLEGIVDRETIESSVRLGGSNPPRDLDSGIQLIFVGRLVEIKNPTKLPCLVSRLPQKYSLRIVGDGPRYEAVKVAIDEAGVNDRVILEGQLSHDETIQLIYDSDLLLLPSEVESYPTVVFEALVLNTPVLATPVGVLPTINDQKLITADLDEFLDTITKIEMESTRGIDTEALERFGVEHFSGDVRDQMCSELFSK